jgi:hypothetical protein
MKRPSMGEAKAAANLKVQNALNPKPNSMEQIAAARAEAAREAAERKFIAHVNALTERVAVLEQALRRLQTCTVQQYADGRIYLPAGNKLTFEVPGVYGVMSSCTVDFKNSRVAAPRPLTAGPPSPAGHVVLSTNVNAPASPLPGSPPPAVQGQALQAPQQSWQSIASSNSINDPRNL